MTLLTLADLPDPSRCTTVALDVETEDTGLRDGHGSAWPWRGGTVLGLAVAWDAEHSGYLNLAHTTGPHVEADGLRRWLHDLVRQPVRLVTHNGAAYDWGWLAVTFGVQPPPTAVDTLFHAALLDEHRVSYSLDALAADCLGARKGTDALMAYARQFGLRTRTKVFAALRQFDPAVVGTYAAEDARLTLALDAWQQPRLVAEGLTTVAATEHALVPLHLAWRLRGVRVDEAAAQALDADLTRRIEEAQAACVLASGLPDFSPWNTAHLTHLADRLGFTAVARTATGRASFTRQWLRTQVGIWQTVAAWRQWDKLRTAFVRGMLLRAHSGRVHPELHPLRSDEYGTVSGRYSASNPNVQQIPKREKTWAPLVRRCFLPEPGHQWCRADYNQQELRQAVHWAAEIAARAPRIARRYRIDTVDVVVERYHAEPRLDFHRLTAELSGISRDAGKTLNFAVLYGAGGAKICAQLGLPTATVIRRGESRVVAGEEAQAVIDAWEAALPFARGLARYASDLVTDRCQRAPHGIGWLTTALRRRARFQYGRRAHKALNALVQGSSADQTKVALLALARDVPEALVHFPVHDEVDASVPDAATAARVAAVMEQAVPLRVPVVVDWAVGGSWGEAMD